MKIKRVFTQKGKSAYHGIEFEKRVSEVKNVDGSGSNQMEVTVPTNRSDIETWADISEEIVRFYGYNNIKSSMLFFRWPQYSLL